MKKELIKQINTFDVSEIKYVHLDYLNQIVENNHDLLAEIISVYLEQTPTQISEMKKSHCNKDFDSLYAIMHKIIPSFSIFGIDSYFENIARKIQEYASEKETSEELADLILQLENVFNKTCVELEEKLTEIKNYQL
jgi:HPt (histidine-containing phosphotransfer) domain-containing protein